VRRALALLRLVFFGEFRALRLMIGSEKEQKQPSAVLSPAGWPNGEVVSFYLFGSVDAVLGARRVGFQASA